MKSSESSYTEFSELAPLLEPRQVILHGSGGEEVVSGKSSCTE
jgi:hypothetical protein